MWSADHNITSKKYNKGYKYDLILLYRLEYMTEK